VPKTHIPYSRQSVDAGDIGAVVRVLKSDWITQGPMVKRFEEAIARFCGVPYAVAVASGTAALHLASLAAGFKPGDKVITTPMTFVASANAIVYTGAKPVFADIDEKSLCLDPLQAKGKVDARTRGIITVDFAGMPSAIGPKQRFSRNKNFTVIQDACHSLGAEVKQNGTWKTVGGCQESDMTIFSFHPVKHLTTGEGGMITTRRKDFYEKLLTLRSHGIEKKRSRLVNKKNSDNPWYYELRSLGFNYRLSDIHCALGISQLKKLKSFVKRRQEIADYYNEAFQGVSEVKTPYVLPNRKSSYHLYVLRFDFNSIKKTRRQVMELLKQKGIGSQVHYIPITQQPYYRANYNCIPKKYPVTEKYYQEALSIPLFPALTDAQAKKVVAEIKWICKPSARGMK